MTFPDSSEQYVDALIYIYMNMTSFVTSAPASARFHVACMPHPSNLHVTIPSELFYNSAFITN